MLCPDLSKSVILFLQAEVWKWSNFLLVQGQINGHNVLVQKNRLAYNFLCLNNLLFRKQYETRYQLSCKQCRSRSGGFFRSTLFSLQHEFIIMNQNTVKPVLSGHSKRRSKIVFKTDYRLMQVKIIAECSKRAFCNTFDLH